MNRIFYNEEEIAGGKVSTSNSFVLAPTSMNTVTRAKHSNVIEVLNEAI